MDTVVIWKEGLAFDGRAEGFNLPMDATPPLGHHYGPGPKEVVAIGLGGCAGMDIIAILKKQKQFIDRFEIKTKIQQSTYHPVVFTSIELILNLEGAIDPAIALHAVELSQTKYSGVSAMLCTSAPLNWILYINGEKVGTGRAHFNNPSEIFQSTYDG